MASSRWARRSARQELAPTPEAGDEGGLGAAAVEAQLERSLDGLARAGARPKPLDVETVAPGDEQADLVTAERIRASAVVNPAPLTRRQLHERRGQVRDVDGTADV